MSFFIGKNEYTCYTIPVGDRTPGAARCSDQRDITSFFYLARPAQPQTSSSIKHRDLHLIGEKRFVVILFFKALVSAKGITDVATGN
jgi:hypothetical protein